MTAHTALRASVSLRPCVVGRRCGGICQPSLDASAALTSLHPTLSTKKAVSGTVVVTTGLEPLWHEGDLPLCTLKVAHR